jgi:hypothetical protein
MVVMRLSNNIHLDQNAGKVYVTSEHAYDEQAPEMSKSLAMSASADMFKELDAEFHQMFWVSTTLFVQWVLVSDYDDEEEEEWNG